MHTEYRWLLGAARPGSRQCGRSSSPARRRRSASVATATRSPATPSAAATTPGCPPSGRFPCDGVRPELDADFAFQLAMRTPVIAAVNGAAAGVGLAVALLRRPALRGRDRQADHGGAQARPARRVRDELDPAATRRPHPGQRPAAVGPGGHRRRRPSRGALWNGVAPDGEAALGGRNGLRGCCWRPPPGRTPWRRRSGRSPPTCCVTIRRHRSPTRCACSTRRWAPPSTARASPRCVSGEAPAAARAHCSRPHGHRGCRLAR